MRGLISKLTSTRTLREGSVGLLFLLGLGAFGAILLWLNRITPGRNSYKAVVEFVNAGGMQKGSPVRYRGVKIGSISKIATGANAVEVEIEINNPNLLIPADSVIEANQSGLISESIIDIVPKATLPTGTDISKPLEKDCNPSLIICNNTSNLKGQIGISVDDLIRQSANFANQYSNEKFYQNINRTLETSAEAASSVANLSRELQSVSKTFKGQIGIFSGTAVTVQRATNELTATSTKTANQLGVTASDFSVTAKQASRLLNNLDDLLTTNRSSLVGALNNITQTSNQLRQTVSSLSPAVSRLSEGELLKNLELLSANAAEASANLKDASKNLNDPKNVVLLQQTLDSARVTFENTQKITSDLDELTGDPKFRQNLLQLVNGLSKLVSSTQDVQQQAKVAVTLDSLKTSLNQTKVITPTQKASVNKSVAKSKVVIPTPTLKEFVLQPNLEISTPPQEKAVIKLEPLPASVESSVESVEKNSQNTSPVIFKSSEEQLLQQLREYRKQETGEMENS
ncbi:MCE family protein [Anabaena cylindrica FACHB-243]|uniref:Mammalian cell entry related domain protein n=1 Tax=Anabaena cylindrica (strain ATCC 27899 / PCC 7122) TaxID=272123 RepID=K9ZMD4_ANACC|nr:MULTISPECIES: MlaD family protein [Anabaena]AFZ60361.1 Mammalian cell entry related domain protein [Anabaena cylindrica PCC 7122]MBD2418915.1 MCE family protein [Anabaena cylindrica FACHB-243]MBY5284863.1 MCE family protein [Anabaena sp. CCAP 1446/1C]MBY5309470.1 MCE family protein [Anabaena sp. CCAP 1446/1C]MCM2404504.1 MlaD family protein [Anabaena sp. CCAP 1446/1C]